MAITTATLVITADDEKGEIHYSSADADAFVARANKDEEPTLAVKNLIAMVEFWTEFVEFKQSKMGRLAAKLAESLKEGEECDCEECGRTVN